MRLKVSLIVLALFVSSLARVGAAQNPEPRLRLHRAQLDRPAEVGWTSVDALRQVVPTYSIIQFFGPITLDERAALEAAGVQILEYIPDFAYLVRGDPAQLDDAERAPGVFARHPFTVADKLAPSLLRVLMQGGDAGRVRIVGWPGSEEALARELPTLPFDVHQSLATAELLQLAKLPSVRWIEPMSEPRLLNDVARTIMQVDPVWQNEGLFGAGQIVGVADSGLDTGITATLSPDFTGRIVATHVLSDGGDLADSFGHGTHVAGSVAGAGVQSGAITASHQYTGTFAGVAPEASLVIQAFEALADGTIVGLDPDYYSLFDQAYADGARVHTNSWGDPTGPITDTEATYGGYPFGSQRVDQFMWDHPDMSIFFAAGNSGADGIPFEIIPGFRICLGGDGVVDPDSLLAPGTAKNVITVGASENNRSGSGYGVFSWGDVDFCFLVNPIAPDGLADNPNGMAAFSSRGPADDGRAKPDIVAPGTNVVSNFSHDPAVNPLFWLKYETNANYAYSNGTSMATPLAAGAGVLAREWLTLRGLPNPSAAAIKATLLNTTADMAPGQYGTGTTQEIPFARPNSVVGWGRVDLGFITAPDPYALWIDDHVTGLVTGQIVTYTHTATNSLEVVDDAQPLRVMLAWTDPPASLSASAQLVNDLDLIVFGPDGTPYYGNGVSSGDRTNNVEGVIVDSPPVGQYVVQVNGYNVPIASQPYALAVGGPIGAVTVPEQFKVWLPVLLRQ